MLQDEVSEMPKNWNRRFKHNRDKIKTGDIYELAEVVRNLALRESEKGLSTGEKQMFTRAKKILASELMYALDKDEDEAEGYLDELLAGARPAARRPWRSSRRGSHARGTCRRRMYAACVKASFRRRTMAVALIVAAGGGERLGAGTPKALVELAGRSLLAWSVDLMLGCDGVQRVVVALPPGVPAPAGTVGVQGGAVRSESVARALAAAGAARVGGAAGAAGLAADAGALAARLAGLAGTWSSCTTRPGRWPRRSSCSGRSRRSPAIPARGWTARSPPRRCLTRSSAWARTGSCPRRSIARRCGRCRRRRCFAGRPWSARWMCPRRSWRRRRTTPGWWSGWGAGSRSCRASART